MDIKNCPIKMADGRYFTNYEPRCMRNAYLNNFLSANNVINSSYEQRLFLQNNSQMIIDDERKRALDALLPCIPCKTGELINEKDKLLQDKYQVTCDGVSCKSMMVNENGLGTGKFF